MRKEFRVEASLHAAVENTLDVPHTAFLHGVLFRTSEKKNVIDVVVKRIFAQDAVMLARQRAQIRAFGGEKYTSTELEVLGPQVTRLLKQAAEHSAPAETKKPDEAHQYRRMKT